MGIAVAAVAALALAACGGDTTTVVNNTTTVTEAATESPTSTTDSAAVDGFQDCGDVAKGGTGIYNVEASQNLKCEYAKNLTDAWLDNCAGGESECAVGDYACVSDATGETAEVTCRGAAEGVEARFVLASFDPS